MDIDDVLRICWGARILYNILPPSKHGLHLFYALVILGEEEWLLGVRLGLCADRVEHLEAGISADWVTRAVWNHYFGFSHFRWSTTAAGNRVLIVSEIVLAHWHAAPQSVLLRQSGVSQADARLHFLDVDRLLQPLFPNRLKFFLSLHQVLQLGILSRLLLGEGRLFLTPTARFLIVLATEAGAGRAICLGWICATAEKVL